MSNSKEKRLQFISAWKTATNAPSAKSTYVPCNRYVTATLSEKEKLELTARGYTVYRHYYVVPHGAQCKISGWLTASHFIYRNMVLGYEWHKGFSEIKCPRKMEAHYSKWDGFLSALRYLETMAGRAKFWIKQTTEEGYNDWVIAQSKRCRYNKDVDLSEEAYHEELERMSGRYLKDFLKPFGGAVTIQDLADIDVDKIKMITKMMKGF